MKRKLFFVSVMVALVAMSVNLSSCGGDDDSSSSGGGGGGSIPSEYVGTWKCDHYCPADNMNEEWAMYSEDGWPPTTVTINGDGSWSGSGLINGNGTCSIKKGSLLDDGYYSMITFYQNGKTVTAQVKTYLNDHKTGYVLLQGYPDKWFIFKK